MIEKLLIKNFQSHRKTLLELSPGVNVIVGRSTTGKSAIVRAFRWLMKNRPAGNAFKSNFAQPNEAVEVRLELPEGNIATSKERPSSGGHQYRVTEYGQSAGVAFSGIGRSVPDMVSAMLNMEEINLQTQLEQHFLITASPREFSKAIDKITQTERFAAAIKKLDRDLRSATNRIATKEERLQEAEERLALYHDWDRLENYVNKAGLENARLQRFAERRRRAININTAAEEWRQKLIPEEVMGKLRQYVVDADVAQQAIDFHTVSGRKIINLGQLNDRILVLDGLVDGYREAVGWVGEMTGKIRFMLRAKKKIRRIRQLKRLVHNIEGDMDRISAQLLEALAELGECPTCGRAIEDEDCVHQRPTPSRQKPRLQRRRPR